MSEARDIRREKVCVVLGGGGARGLAHLGVLRVFEHQDVPVDCLVGTSVGAVVGACYALHPDSFSEGRRALAYLNSEAFAGNAFKKVFFKSEDVERNVFSSFFTGLLKSYVFSNLLRKPAIFPGEKLQEVIHELVPDKDFADCKIPFAVPALDLRSGEEVLLREGPLRPAVLASCSLPGFFPPVRHQGRLLADAGVIGPVPVSAARELFDPTTVIAVDISSSLEHKEEMECGLDVILRVEAIAGERLNSLEIEKADVLIQPDVGRKRWSDFSNLEAIVNEGVIATEPLVPAVRSAIARGRRRSFFWNPIP